MEIELKVHARVEIALQLRPETGTETKECGFGDKTDSEAEIQRQKEGGNEITEEETKEKRGSLQLLQVQVPKTVLFLLPRSAKLHTQLQLQVLLQ